MAKTTTFATLKAYATRINDDSLDGKASAYILEAIQDALRNLANNPWSFLVKRTRVVTQPDRSTPGAVSIAPNSRAVRFTSLVNPAGRPPLDGTWTVKFSGEDIDYDFASTATTTSLINVTSSFVGVTSTNTGTYRVFKRTYDLPSDFRELLSIVDVRRPRYGLEPKTYQSMLMLHQTRSSGDTPYAYSVENKSGDMARQLWLYPLPSGTTRFQYDLIYARWPTIPASGDADNTVIDWPDDLLPLLKAAIGVELAKKAKDQMQYDLANSDYQEKLTAAGKSDVKESADMFIGGQGPRRWPGGFQHYDVTEGG